MTRVAKGSSSNGSSPVANKLPVFDIKTEAGTLALLRALHRSGVRQKDKNELRDQLFEYVQKPGKGKQVLFEAFKEAGFELVEEGESVTGATKNEGSSQPVAQTGFGQSRVVPSFAPASVRSSAAAAEEPVSASEQPESKEVPEPAPTDPEVKEEVSAEPAPEAPADEVVAEPTEEEPAQEVSEPEEPESEPVPAAVPDPKPDTATPTTPSPTPVPESGPADIPAPAASPATATVSESEAVSTASDNPMERIKEIKHVINLKVGNPITLIDTDNQVGREYMNALLSAMKAANGGTPAESVAAMDRLEKAYAEALRVIATVPKPDTVTDQFVKSAQTEAADSVAHGYAEAETPTPSPQPAPTTPEPEPEPEPVTAPEPVSVPEPIPEPVQQVTESAAQQVPPTSVKLPVTSMDHEPTPTPTPTPAPAPAPAPAPVQEPPAPIPSEPPAQNEVPPVTPQVSAVAKKPVDPGTPSYIAPGMPTPPPLPDDAEQAASLQQTTAASQSSVQMDPPAAPVSTPAAPPVAAAVDQKRLMSVAKEEQLQKLMQQNQLQEAEQQKQQEDAARASTDPLMLPEVTAGLQQLLSEWSLFKSSGFFGTGPGGVDHPLYQKIAPLTLSAVIAGRFEGATPQVKQSITEYMNGWRYEEGIVHEHSETFEHYLRRVISHILSKKNSA